MIGAIPSNFNNLQTFHYFLEERGVRGSYVFSKTKQHDVKNQIDFALRCVPWQVWLGRRHTSKHVSMNLLYSDIRGSIVTIIETQSSLCSLFCDRNEVLGAWVADYVPKDRCNLQAVG